MSIKQIAASNGLSVLAWAPGRGKVPAKPAPVAKPAPGAKQAPAAKPTKVAPPAAKKPAAKPAVKPAQPQQKKPAVQPYSKMANSRAAGLLKLAIKWAKTAPDPETKRALIAGIKVLKKVYWARLSAESKKELNEL